MSRWIDADALKPDYYDEYILGDDEYVVRYYSGTQIDNAPSIDADRPQGEWRKHDDERDYCSRCKHIFKTRTITQQDKWTLYIDDLGYNYCPNCGAHMKGADDE